MFAFIIFGTTNLTFKKQTGKFYCPNCGTTRDYQEKSVRRFFTLYFIPLIPLDQVARYVECGRCQASFDTQVLTLDADTVKEAHRRQFAEHCRRLMILMMLADGVASDEEIAVVNRLSSRVGADPYSAEEMSQSVAMAREAEISVTEYAREIAPQLSSEEMEEVIRCLFLVASARGEMGETQQAMLMQLPAALGVSEDELRRVIGQAASE